MTRFSASAARGVGRKREIHLYLQSASSGDDHPLY